MRALPPAEAEARRRLASGLRRMQTQPVHGYGCSCCGGGLVALGAAAIEADLLGLLARHYREVDDAALLDLVERRLAAGGGSLLDWLERVGGTEPGCADRLLGDLLAAVERAAPQGPPQGRFRATGWDAAMTRFGAV